MAELTTIARPYAEAAFRLAREGNALPTWSQMLRLLAMVIADPKVAGALDNPRLTAGDKASLATLDLRRATRPARAKLRPRVG